MSVKIEGDLEGKINNLPNFKTEALMPVFEAVVNSIQGIEDRPRVNIGAIMVRINRSSQNILPGVEVQKPITGFEIEDNGIGFDDKNYNAFRTADTTHKIKRGCKGIGRFYWLKAFEQVQIESVYTEGRQRMHRSIQFTRGKGFEELSNEDTTHPQKTIVKLIGY